MKVGAHQNGNNSGNFDEYRLRTERLLNSTYRKTSSHIFLILMDELLSAKQCVLSYCCDSMCLSKCCEGKNDLAIEFVLLMRKGIHHLKRFEKRNYLRKLFLTNLHKVPSLHGPPHWEFCVLNHPSDTKEFCFCKGAFCNIFQISSRAFDRYAREMKDFALKMTLNTINLMILLPQNFMILLGFWLPMHG